METNKLSNAARARMYLYLLAKNGYDVDKAKRCWNFVNDSKEEPASNRLGDGIYLIGSECSLTDNSVDDTQAACVDYITEE